MLPIQTEEEEERNKNCERERERSGTEKRMREPQGAVAVESNNATMPPQALLERLKDYGQEDAFALWDELSPEERDLLVKDMEVISSSSGSLTSFVFLLTWFVRIRIVLSFLFCCSFLFGSRESWETIGKWKWLVKQLSVMAESGLCFSLAPNDGNLVTRKLRFLFVWLSVFSLQPNGGLVMSLWWIWFICDQISVLHCENKFLYPCL